VPLFYELTFLLQYFFTSLSASVQIGIIYTNNSNLNWFNQYLAMIVTIKNSRIWLQGLNTAQALETCSNMTNLPKEFLIPKPQYFPKAQLRRLSPFSRVILDCLDMPEALTQNLPVVFSSQHGDLAKTVKLIKDAVDGEELSPTQFALSVHNSTTGLFSIATKNTAPTTTISAGENTFIEGLVEATMQVTLDKTDVLYVYCDFPVPEEYRQFEDNKPARCIALVLSAENNKTKNLLSLNIEPGFKKNDALTNDNCLDFISMCGKQKQKAANNITCGNYTLRLSLS
jgi:hypothetical protein